MNASEQQLKDFLENPSFQNWAQQSNPEDIAFWEEWLKANPDKKELAEEAAGMIRGLQFKKKSLPDEMIRDSWKALEQRLTEDRAAFEAVRQKRSYKFIYRMAAVWALILASVTLYFMFFNTTQHEVVTQAGEIRQINLADRSEIILRANTQLTYEENNWSNAVEEVWLDGEAFFIIEKRADDAFKVHTGQLTVEVLGTQFNVFGRRERSGVVLSTGKVRLTGKNGEPELIMNPGELAAFSEKDQHFTVRKVNPQHYISWISNKLYFNETPLSEIVQLLEDVYNLQVKVDDKELLERTLSGAIEVEKAQDLLDAISLTLGIEVTKEKNIVTLKKRVREPDAP